MLAKWCLCKAITFRKSIVRAAHSLAENELVCPQNGNALYVCGRSLVFSCALNWYDVRPRDGPQIHSKWLKCFRNRPRTVLFDTNNVVHDSMKCKTQLAHFWATKKRANHNMWSQTRDTMTLQSQLKCKKMGKTKHPNHNQRSRWAKKKRRWKYNAVQSTANAVSLRTYEYLHKQIFQGKKAPQ